MGRKWGPLKRQHKGSPKLRAACPLSWQPSAPPAGMACVAFSEVVQAKTTAGLQVACCVTRALHSE